MSETRMPAYIPPQPAFFRCRCGQLVLKLKGEVLTPALGYKHVCKVKEKAA